MEERWGYDYELERRLAFRLSLRTHHSMSVSLFDNGIKVAEGRAADIALGGISVVLDEPLPGSMSGCRAQFELPAGDGSTHRLDLACEVVHVTETPASVVCGLEFLDIQSRSKIQDFSILWDFIARELEKSHPAALR